MKIYLRTLAGARGYQLLLIVVLLLNILPPLGSAVTLAVSRGDGSDLLEFAIFALAALPIVSLLAYWSKREAKTWLIVLSIIMGWVLTVAFTAIFSDSFSNAYLSSLLLIQVVFLVYGLRFGTFAIALVVLADGYRFLAHQEVGFAANFFALTVEATVGIIAWMFVHAANAKRDEAEQAAAVAKASDTEAQKLAGEVSVLNRLLLTSQDREMGRLARDIHDGPLQSLGVELLAIARVRRALEANNLGRVAVELDYLESIARESVGDLRDTVNSLRNTVLDAGIVPALQNLARKIEETTSMKVSVKTSFDCDRKMPETIAACIHQLTIEALNNIRKHARADNVTIRLLLHGTNDTDGLDGVNGVDDVEYVGGVGDANGEEITLTIEDDGEGFDYETSIKRAINDGHIGLYSMRERAVELGGRMAVISARGKGTTLSFTFPMTLLMPQSGPPTKPLPFLLSA
jgi:signal transduction histidine kinase